MVNSDAPKKSLGQHWLRDSASLEAIVKVAELADRDLVLEIGPGEGSLTELLIKRAGRVVAVEIDDKLAARLPRQLSADNLEVINQDILQFDFTSLPADYKVVANIPYYLTSNLIRVISETPNQPLRVVILVQREVAARVAARPGTMSLLSVTTQFYWQVSLGRVVAAELFEPPPKIDSQILLLKRRPAPLYPDVDPKDFFRLAKAGFAQRRKTLLNGLTSGLNMNRQDVGQVCEVANIDPGRRAQTLSLEEWHKLYLAVKA